ncbi:hypothetical protein [Candidatus Clavichlamydia salmonicola]|uniref:hypothetical protein n=1 Tax=Candidatus Clavichlamydia salmonicola TaxID=469812 RepID=UPI00189106ED|nr:hypothetical protein [Candidatus Clavichlamydia salmonicola]
MNNSIVDFPKKRLTPIVPDPEDPFIKGLELVQSIEDKLRYSVDFMRDCLFGENAPDLKNFRTASGSFLIIFKTVAHGAVRSQLWHEYIELSNENRRLKEITEQEVSFAVDQLELAIASLETDVEAFFADQELFIKRDPSITLNELPKAFQESEDEYRWLHARLVWLNAFVSRISGLRKELIAIGARIRIKNKFFQRLSTLGDKLFPLRKELIKQVSEKFEADVKSFEAAYFADEVFNRDNVKKYVFFLREEIKNLQSVAKLLVLNTHAFSSTRKLLSGCWDQLKGLEKEIKRYSAENKKVSSENVVLVKERAAQLSEKYLKGEITPDQGFSEVDAILRWMRQLDLVYADVISLKDMLRETIAPFEQAKDDEENLRREKREKIEQAHGELVQSFKEKISTLITAMDNMTVGAVREEWESLKKGFVSLPSNKTERQVIERSLKEIKDKMIEKEESNLLALSDDDRATLDNLIHVVGQRRERRKELKGLIEEYRKIISGSGLDFEQAILYNSKIEAEKELLGKMDEGIKELDLKISEIRKKTK